MKKYLFIVLFCFGCNTPKPTETAKAEVNEILDQWHKAAAEANFDNYFNALSEDAIFIGTDATENWNKTDFMAYSKPYFDRGKAWSFKALERNVFIAADGKTAWFDELLNTQMKICRGSGILTNENNQWKIRHYVLSMTIPNENSNVVIKAKDSLESLLIQQLQK
ncbi:nuclear transport factor 2 family protein [Flavobacterium sp. UBA6135]|uniref:nuclear transport factor 2 family protein n=1 Tax=Flavobacterium sp. UBA6135 TaxID=1946553 RepID=UPI0025C0F04F|nr:nuclear transport factor 2 family protein [Flavobacterium sp. UBA6135]